MERIHVPPLFLLALALSQLLLCSCFPNLFSFPLPCAFFCFVMLAPAMHGPHPKGLIFLVACNYLLYLLLGWALHAHQPFVPFPTPLVTELEGTVLEDSLLAEEDLHLCRLTLRSCKTRWGAVGSASGSLSALCASDEFLIAGSTIKVAGCFGEEAGLFYSDTFQVLEIPPFAILRRSILEKLVSFSQRRFDDGNARSLALMLLLGRSSDEAFTLKELSIESGCAHTLALSGLHLQFFLRLSAAFCSFFLGSFWGKRIGLLLPISYVTLVGPKPSLLRALGMHLCALVLPVSREVKSTIAYWLTLLLHLFLIPASIQSYGFLFSYLSYGMLLFANYLPPFKPQVLDSFRVTALAILVTGLPSLNLMGSWNLAGLLLSLPATVLIHLAMVFSFLGLCFGSPFTDVFAYLSQALHALLSFGAEALGVHLGLNGLVLYLLVVLTCLVSIGYAGHALQKKRRNSHELAVRIRFTRGHQRLVGY